MKGAIIALGENGPAHVEYSISCDTAWRTRRARVVLRDSSGERSLLVKTDKGRWFENGRQKKSVTGCTDIDLGWSPSTNTIAIRRLALRVGERSDPVTAAWLRFPELRLEPLTQEYERLGDLRYRYVSRKGAFRAIIVVDADGLVLEYERYWRRI